MQTANPGAANPGHPILKLAALALVASLAAPAHAEFGYTCPTGGCEFDPADGNPFDLDYTVPPDGRLYRWTIDYHSADPLASISLADPNQTEVITLTRTATGFEDGYDGNPPYTFIEHRSPGRSTYTVRAPRAFDICDQPGPIGQICFADVHIWGNGGRLSVSGTAPVFATFSESLVPEPATWGLLLIGFAMVGASMRRRLPLSP